MSSAIDRSPARAVREASGLSLRQVGLLVGVSHETIRTWEAEEFFPDSLEHRIWMELLDSLIGEVLQ